MGKAADPREFRKALIMDIGGIGDMVIATAFLRNFKTSFPQCHVTVLSSLRSGEVLKGLRYADEIIGYDFHDIRLRDVMTFSKKARDGAALVSLLRERRFDVAINLLQIASFSSSLKMAAIFFAIAPGIRAGRDTANRGWFYHIKVKETDKAVMHDTELHARLLEMLGGSAASLSPELVVLREDRNYAEKLLSESRIREGKPLILVNPGSNWPSKQWPVENFVQTIRLLKKTTDAVFAVTGSGSELSLAEAIKAEEHDTLIIAGKTNIHQLAALLLKADLFITNDTGPVHIAVALGTPVVAICGPVNYKRFFSYFDGMIRKDYNCSPCSKVECDDMGCLKSITPEEVAEKALWLLSKK